MTPNPSSTPTLKALRETPTARIYAVGASAASLVELLGAVLGNPDTALAVLNQFPTLEDIARASNVELEDVAGIGKPSAARIRAALELGRRLVSTMPHERPSITSPADAASLVMSEMSLLEQEVLRVILLDTRNRVQAMQKHGVQRIVCVSAAGFLGEQADFLIGKALFWYFGRNLKILFEAMRLQFQALERSGLRWIAVRPVLLDEGLRKGHYRVVLKNIPSHGYRINTGDVAEFMLRQLSSDEYVGQAPAIAY